MENNTVMQKTMNILILFTCRRGLNGPTRGQEPIVLTQLRPLNLTYFHILDLTMRNEKIVIAIVGLDHLFVGT